MLESTHKISFSEKLITALGAAEKLKIMIQLKLDVSLRINVLRKPKLW